MDHTVFHEWLINKHNYDLVCSQYPGCLVLPLGRLLVLVSPFLRCSIPGAVDWLELYDVTLPLWVKDDQ